MSQENLRMYLATTLKRLNELTDSIRKDQPYTVENEVYFMLRELISEQMGTTEGESISHPNNPPR
jgi:hypothetical protein